MSTTSQFVPVVGSPVLLTRRGNRELSCYEGRVERITPSGMVVVSYGDPKSEKRYYKPKWGGEWREHGESIYGSYRWSVFFDKDIGPERELTAALLAEQEVIAEINRGLAAFNSGHRFHEVPTHEEIASMRRRIDVITMATNSAEGYRKRVLDPKQRTEN